MRKALVIGINYYEYGGSLFGCVDDAHAVKAILERDGDGTVNFDVKLITGTGPSDVVTRAEVIDSAVELFKDESDIALFYFAGHGNISATGGYIMASDSGRIDEGISLNDLLILANKSNATSKVIILDSCHSGIAGDSPTDDDNASLSQGLTILTASTKDQYATEENGRGVFTTLLVDALSGAAANLVGAITPGSVYAHIDQSLGSWEQRPVFKTNVKAFVPLRKVSSAIELSDLREITSIFKNPGDEMKLDPTFEPEMKGRDPGMPDPIPENVRRFGLLQKYNRLNLLVPVDAPHMWHAAMQSKSCKLTMLGEHYWRLVRKNRI